MKKLIAWFVKIWIFLFGKKEKMIFKSALRKRAEHLRNSLTHEPTIRPV